MAKETVIYFRLTLNGRLACVEGKVSSGYSLDETAQLVAEGFQAYLEDDNIEKVLFFYYSESDLNNYENLVACWYLIKPKFSIHGKSAVDN